MGVQIQLVVISACLLCGTYGADSLKFMVLGDMGGIPFFPYSTPAQTGTSDQVAKHAAEEKPKFILALGDNFYFQGVANVNDARFKESFEDVYHQPSLQIPWYLIAGNHDHYGNVSAEIVYSKQSKRWNFPNYYYPLSFEIPNTKLNIDILMLDTVQLCGNTDYDFIHSQPSHIENIEASEQQWKWLEKSLANSSATYLIVAGHFPVYSIAEHGPTSCLVDRLLPMLYKYHVTAYLCGHDHSLQHLQQSNNSVTVDFFVIGASNFVDPSQAHASAVPEGVSKFFWGDLLSLGGFSSIDINPNNMTLRFIEGDGKSLYKHVMLPRKM